MTEPKYSTLGGLIAAAKACGNHPSVIGGREFFTMVIDLDRRELRLEPTTVEEYATVKGRSPSNRK